MNRSTTNDAFPSHIFLSHSQIRRFVDALTEVRDGSTVLDLAVKRRLPVFISLIADASLGNSPGTHGTLNRSQAQALAEFVKELNDNSAEKDHEEASATLRYLEFLLPTLLTPDPDLVNRINERREQLSYFRSKPFAPETGGAPLDEMLYTQVQADAIKKSSAAPVEETNGAAQS